MISIQSLYKMLFFLTTVFFALSPLKISATNYILRIPALIIIVMLISKLYSHTPRKCIFSITTLIVIFLLHFVADTPVTIDIFLSCFSLIAYLLLIIVSDTISLNQETYRFINSCSIVSALVLIGYSISPISHLATFEGYTYQSPYLTYGFDNSNYAGIVTLLVYSLLFLTKETAGKIVKKLCIFLGIILFYLIYQTNTRSALAVAILIPFLNLFFNRFTLKNWMLFLIVLIPFLFVPLYLQLGASGNAEDAQIMGKSIMSGRQFVYASYIEKIHSPYNWLVGNLSENKLMNAHNGPLAILASCGLLGCVSYFYIYFSKLFRANRLAKTHMNKIAVFIIAACFLNTCGEAALLLGGFPAITYLFAFFVFANSNNKNQTA